MKILAINGSHRGRAGCTQWLIDRLAEGAVEAGAEFETVVLAEQQVTPCAGCETCHTSEHYLRCIYEDKDDVAAIFARMRAAELIIYASPVYVFGFTGRLKTFLDRFNSTAGTGELGLTASGLFFGKADRALCSKPFVVLTCCGNVETETYASIEAYFRSFSRFLDAPQVGLLTRRSVGMLPCGEAAGTAQDERAVAVVAAYVQAGRELASRGRISAATQRQANRHLLPIPFLDFLLKFRLFKKLALRRSGK